MVQDIIVNVTIGKYPTSLCACVCVCERDVECVCECV